MAAIPIRALLADDEPIARQILREELHAVADIELIGEAADGQQALHQIQTLHPDLVFLDLQMPLLDGFGVVGRLNGDHLPSIVIVTAYEQHAVQAFEAGAIDYLLKPVRQERLAQCLERVRQRRKQAGAVAESIARIQEISPPGEFTTKRKMVGRSGNQYVILDIADVLALKADNDIVWILTAKNRYTATQSLKTMAEKLESQNFLRAHRNCLVNMDHVAKMAPISSQRWLLTLTNQIEIIVSKRQAYEVQKLLGW